MINKTFYLFVLAAFFIASAGFVYNLSNNGIFKTINVNIVKSQDNSWRVQDNDGNFRGTLKANRADNINWLAVGSPMKFRFQDGVETYFEYDEDLFKDGKTQLIDQNKRLSLKIKPDAPADTLVYDVYVVNADTFVIGNSPPVLIIDVQ